MEEQSPTTTRRLQLDRARRENLDILNKTWNFLIQAFFQYSVGDFDPNKPAFSNILDAAIEFINACYKEKKHYTQEEITALLYQMREKLSFHVEHLPLTQQTVFFSSFESFITATQQTFLARVNDPEMGEHFQRLTLWLPDVLRASVFSFEPKCSLSAERYCEAHREKTETIKRIGSAIAVFVDCHSMQNQGRNILNAFSDEQVVSFQIREMNVRYQSLRSSLAKAGRLTPDLNERLMAEERKNANAIHANPRGSIIEFAFTEEIHAILRDLLRNDTAEILDQFLPKDKHISEPTRLLSDVLLNDYFPTPKSETDTDNESERTEPAQAPLTAQGMLEVDSQYKSRSTTALSNCMKLLGDGNKLTTAALTERFRNIPPLDQLEILEQLFVAIKVNADEIYDISELSSGKNNHTKAQSKHIGILQNFYLAIIKTNPLEQLKFRIEDSQLLDYSPSSSSTSAKKPTLKKETLELWERLHASAIAKLNVHVPPKKNIGNDNNTRK